MEGKGHGFEWNEINKEKKKMGGKNRNREWSISKLVSPESSASTLNLIWMRF